MCVPKGTTYYEFVFLKLLFELHHQENIFDLYAKTKGQLSCAVKVQLADQRLCFHYIDGTIPLLAISEISRL